MNIKGDWSRWIIKAEVTDDGGSNIKSKNKGLINLPQTGWQYVGNDDGWHDDNTLKVKGKKISCRGDAL